ncbi:MAG TPA: hypothetical protein VF572_05365 [Candidatus Saccharimonadales bacterium]|jgi:hypothetical protein
MNLIKTVQRWHQTKAGLLSFALAESALGYLFLTWAIDKGNPLDYFLAFVLLIGVIQNLVRLGMKVSRADG